MHVHLALCICATACLASARPAAAQQFIRAGKTHLPAVVDEAGGLASADLDGDGDRDIVAVSYGCTVRIFRNDGHARFVDVAASAFRGAAPPRSYGVALGDVDGNGTVDLVLGATSTAGNTDCRLFLNDGTGTLTDVTAVWIPPGTGGPAYEIVLHDIDGNGTLDMLLSRGGVALYDNVGGRFIDRTAARVPAAAWVYAIACGDVDGNGFADLVLGVHNPTGSSQNRLFLNAAGVFRDATANLPQVHNFTLGVALGDVDGNGTLDILVVNGEGNTGGNQDELWLNNGAGVFVPAPPGHLPVEDDDGEDAALVDVDGNGTLDALVANLGQSRCYLNRGGGMFTDGTATVLPAGTWSALDLAVDDWNGDGRPDLYGGGSVEWSHLLLNDGQGRFLAGSAELFAWNLEITPAVAVADFDGNGFVDLYLAQESGLGSQDRMFRNGARGFVDATSDLPQARVSTRQVLARDFDRDGDMDLLRADLAWTVSHVLLENNGAGVFSDATGRLGAAGTLPTGAVECGDLDRDGLPDILLSVTSGIPPSREVLLRADGNGGFVDASCRLPACGVTSSATQDLELADVDGDGDLDILVAASPDRLYLNQWPALAFVQAPFPASASRQLAAADVDGDRDVDVVAVGGGCRLYVNAGNGTFVDRTAAAMPPLNGNAVAVAVADADLDGDTDIAVASGAGFSGAQNQIYVNDGSGMFRDATATRLMAGVSVTLAIAFADLDGDGDPELICGNRDDWSNPCGAPVPLLRETRVLVNHHRQAGAPTLAQIGASYVLQFHVEPGYATGGRAVLPFLAVGAAPLLPVPVVLPFGAFRLAPPVTTLPASSVPASGEIGLPLAIPNLVLLLGQHVACQAAVLHASGQVGMTNAWADRFVR
jgi:hypothetical protein